MPRGGARPGSGRPKGIPDAIAAAQKPPAAKKSTGTKPSKPPAAKQPAAKQPAKKPSAPVLFLKDQAVGISMDYESIMAATVAWLKSKNVYEHIDPGLLEEYVTCLARARQYEQAISLGGVAEMNLNSGQEYEKPISKAARDYMKRAQAARALMYDVIRRVGAEDTDGNGKMINLIGGVPVWREPRK